jgi:regulator of telomere elongation helicase 1
MPILNIRNVPVDFPKQPYECQVNYMDKVIEALNTNKNALLESPTGTGKTLCLLCSTLAWQKFNNNPGKDIVKVEPKNKPSTASVKAVVEQKTSSNFSVIIYATRTHSQLMQVVDELRSTAYRPRMSVLGSRDQLCVHDKISKLKGNLLNHACNAINARRGCMYRNNLENFLQTSVTSENEILDIEDLAKMGNSRKICPFFYTREFSSGSDIVFMPYNYLLDGAIRKTLKIPWQNAVVIFDEAHNLERIASDAASFTLTSTDIASCIQELQQVVQVLKEEFEQRKNEKKSNSNEFAGPSSNIQIEMNSTVQKPSLAMAASLLKAMFEFEKKIDTVPLYSSDQQAPSSTMDGSWLVQSFVTAGFNSEMVRILSITSVPSNFILSRIVNRGTSKMFKCAYGGGRRGFEWSE